MIYQDNVVWVQCKLESPEAPLKTALYLPIKFSAPVICQFRQRSKWAMDYFTSIRHETVSFTRNKVAFGIWYM